MHILQIVLSVILFYLFLLLRVITGFFRPSISRFGESTKMGIVCLRGDGTHECRSGTFLEKTLSSDLTLHRALGERETFFVASSGISGIIPEQSGRDFLKIGIIKYIEIHLTIYDYISMNKTAVFLLVFVIFFFTLQIANSESQPYVLPEVMREKAYSLFSEIRNYFFPSEFKTLVNYYEDSNYRSLKEEYLKSHPGQTIIPFPWEPGSAIKVLPFNLRYTRSSRKSDIAYCNPGPD